MDEKGYIKFNCDWNPSPAFKEENFVELKTWRNTMYKKGWIGEYPNGIGYGNISCRHQQLQFYITGTATGGLQTIDERHVTLVTAYNLNENSLICEGPVKASSESLTHAVIYQELADVNAVIHIHNLALWNNYLNVLPSTSNKIEYGTPEMAEEVIRLLKLPLTVESEVIVMGGHKEGIISFGKNMKEAANRLLHLQRS